MLTLTAGQTGQKFAPLSLKNVLSFWSNHSKFKLTLYVVYDELNVTGDDKCSHKAYLLSRPSLSVILSPRIQLILLLT